jgi:hypothetical protein
MPPQLHAGEATDVDMTAAAAGLVVYAVLVLCVAVLA